MKTDVHLCLQALNPYLFSTELNMWYITGTIVSASMTFMCTMEVRLLFLLVLDTYIEVINKMHGSDYKEYFWDVIPCSLAEVYCFR